MHELFFLHRFSTLRCQTIATRVKRPFPKTKRQETGSWEACAWRFGIREVRGLLARKAASDRLGNRIWAFQWLGMLLVVAWTVFWLSGPLAWKAASGRLESRLWAFRAGGLESC